MKHTIRLLPRNDNSCGWINTLTPGHNFDSLKGKQSADWVIIGGGFTGLAFARRMATAKPNEKIIIVDAQNIGEGASSRNSGFAVATSSFGEKFNGEKLAEFKRINSINNAGIDSLRSIIHEHKIDCQWREIGKYHCSAQPSTKKAGDDFQAWLDAAQVEHQVLNATDLAKRLGTDYYQNGVWTKDDVMLQPAALVRGLSNTLAENVTLYDNSAVIQISTSKHAVHIRTDEGEITAKNIVIAGNGLLHKMIDKPTYTLPIKMTASLTRPLTSSEQAIMGNPKDWGILSLHPMGATVRYTADHRILIRNTATYKANPYLTDNQMQAAKQMHLNCLRQRFAMLKDIDFEHTWQGVLCVSRNSSSIFGQLAPRIYGAGCYNASGVSRGSAMGLALADLALGRDNPLLSDVLQYPAPTWMPPRPFLDIAMALEIRRKKLGARADV
ncbi:FAD-binding oxidoreductase [Gammaproteobacteria bacterium AS21]